VQRHDCFAGRDRPEGFEELDEFDHLEGEISRRGHVTPRECCEKFQKKRGRIIVSAADGAGRAGREAADERLVDSEGDVKFTVVNGEAPLVFKEVAIVELDSPEVRDAAAGRPQEVRG
jgi:hypothetical protein